jgi:hypothetical protein
MNGLTGPSTPPTDGEYPLEPEDVLVRLIELNISRAPVDNEALTKKVRPALDYLADK